MDFTINVRIHSSLTIHIHAGCDTDLNSTYGVDEEN